MKEKLIVFSLTLNISFIVYILELPNRNGYAPGGELFLVPFMGLVWLVGHEMKKEIEYDRKYTRRK